MNSNTKLKTLNDLKPICYQVTQLSNNTKTYWTFEFTGDGYTNMPCYTKEQIEKLLNDEQPNAIIRMPSSGNLGW